MGKYHCTVDLLFDLDWNQLYVTTYNFCFYLQNRLIQTSQTGGQWYSDTPPFSIPWLSLCLPIQTSLKEVESMSCSLSRLIGPSFLA